MKTRLKAQVELIRELNGLHGKGLAHQTQALRTWLRENGYEDKVVLVVIPESVHDTLKRAMQFDYDTGRREMSDKDLSEIMSGGPDDNPALERLRAKLQAVADGGKLISPPSRSGRPASIVSSELVK